MTAAATPPILPTPAFLRNRQRMEEQGLSQALERAEAALERVEQAVSRLDRERGRDGQLRDRVRDAVAELDQLIRAANG